MKPILVDSVFCPDSEYDVGFHTFYIFWNQNTLNTFQKPYFYKYPQDEVSKAKLFSSIFLCHFVALTSSIIHKKISMVGNLVPFFSLMNVAILGEGEGYHETSGLWVKAEMEPVTVNGRSGPVRSGTGREFLTGRYTGTC